MSIFLVCEYSNMSHTVFKVLSAYRNRSDALNAMNAGNVWRRFVKEVDYDEGN
jgi:hypothetical protein